jgi:phi LC3 family holin
MNQSRFKSWAVWVSVAGAVWVILSAFGLPEQWGVTSEAWNGVLNALGTILIAFGILNNPTDKTSF